MPELRPDETWNDPKPEKIPRPTFWPATLAFGVTFLLWGIVTMWIVSALGLVIIAVAIGGWIREIIHEHQ
jgi:hypothetical protein